MDVVVVPGRHLRLAFCLLPCKEQLCVVDLPGNYLVGAPVTCQSAHLGLHTHLVAVLVATTFLDVGQEGLVKQEFPCPRQQLDSL